MYKTKRGEDQWLFRGAQAKNEQHAQWTSSEMALR